MNDPNLPLLYPSVRLLQPRRWGPSVAGGTTTSAAVNRSSLVVCEPGLYVVSLSQTAWSPWRTVQLEVDRICMTPGTGYTGLHSTGADGSPRGCVSVLLLFGGPQRATACSRRTRSESGKVLAVAGATGS